MFQTMLANATRICGAKFGTLFRFDGENFHPVAQFNTPTALLEAQMRRGPIKPTPGTPMDRVMRTKQVIHSADNAAEPFPGLAAKLAGARSLVAVPMLKDDALTGAILIYRQEVRPFTDKQIELVQNFAAQAVIAIENTRLLNELRQSLEQQTATADVLRVISGSPGELEPVFQTILQNGARLCEAKFGNLYLYRNGALHNVASHNVPSAFAEVRRRRGPWHPTPNTALAKVIRTKQTVHVIDLADTPVYRERVPEVVDAVELGGVRTTVMVPMLRENELVGIIVIFRQEVRPYTDKQIELLQNFAAQAVIAIENARLLNELRDSLEQQTATADVLRVISSSPGDLEPVFQAMLENATRICEAKFGVMFRFDDDVSYPVAMLNLPPVLDEYFRTRGRRKPTPGSDLENLWKSKQAVHTIDMLQSSNPSPPARLAGARTQLAVPMLMDDELIGAIAIYRQEVRPFTGKQIALVTNFAAQAVIAIENTRLLNELRESLQQQTATSEVLGVISSSPGELAPVFQTMLANATRICEAKFGTLFRFDGENFHPVAQFNTPTALLEAQMRRGPIKPTPGTPMDRVMRTKQVIHSADNAAEPFPGLAAKLAGARSLVAVPMLKDDALTGAILIYRQEVRPFTDKQIELVQNFAAQAVIAIENTRLLNELRQSLERQTATSEVLHVISSSPGDLKPVFDAILENATRICQASFGALHLAEGDVYRNAATYNVPPAYAEARQRDPMVSMSGNTALARVAKTKSAVQIADVTADPAYREDPQRQKFVTLTGARTLISVPMLKDDTLIGVITVYRLEVQSFTDKQIELVQNFAAQAVIAIENARLLKELRQRTEDLSEISATADRHRRSAQVDHPVDLQPANRPRHTYRIGRKPV